VTRRRLPAAAAIAAVLALAVGLDHALAQAAMPFGVGRPDAAVSGPPGSFGAWVMAEQSRFYRQLSAAIRAAKENGGATWGLVGLSLAYGVFHAAGPGHGKAVISGYLFASGETLKKGIALAFVSAFVQALTAVVLVAGLALLAGATAGQMDDFALALERASYGLIALVGALLVVRKGAAFWAMLGPRLGLAAVPAHVHGSDCGHIPLPVAGPGGGLRGSVGTVLAVGVRPCTGAIIVLVFALAQGIFLAGIAATFAMAVGTATTVAAIASVAVLAKGLAIRLAAPGSFSAALALRGLELLAALAVLCLGLSLLLGAMVPVGQA
jgi:nickel/cobalt exporter